MVEALYPGIPRHFCLGLIEALSGFPRQLSTFPDSKLLIQHVMPVNIRFAIGRGYRNSNMDILTLDDFQERFEDLIRNAQAGKLSVITKHGHPVFIAVPFDEILLKEGVHVALAVKLYDEEFISQGKAAKLAGMSLSRFIDHLGCLRIPVVRYGQADLQAELDGFD